MPEEGSGMVQSRRHDSGMAAATWRRLPKQAAWRGLTVCGGGDVMKAAEKGGMTRHNTSEAGHGAG